MAIVAATVRWLPESLRLDCATRNFHRCHPIRERHADADPIHAYCYGCPRFDRDDAANVHTAPCGDDDERIRTGRLPEAAR